MRVRGVDDDHVHPGIRQRHGPIPLVTTGSHCGPDQQPPVGILGGIGVLFCLDEVLHRDQTGQATVTVDDRELLDLVPSQQAERGFGGHTLLSGDQWRFGHHLGDRPVLIDLETHVPVGDDADELAGVVGDGQARDTEAGTHRVDLGQRVRRATGHRIGDHAGFGPLDRFHLPRLVLDREVAVQHTHPTCAGHRDGHAGFGDGVHRRAHQGHPQRDVAGQLRRGVHVARDHVGGRGQQQDVVKGEAEHGDLVRVVAAGPHRASCLGGAGCRVVHSGHAHSGQACSTSDRHVVISMSPSYLLVGPPQDVASSPGRRPDRGPTRRSGPPLTPGKSFTYVKEDRSSNRRRSFIHAVHRLAPVG